MICVCDEECAIQTTPSIIRSYWRLKHLLQISTLSAFFPASVVVTHNMDCFGLLLIRVIYRPCHWSLLSFRTVEVVGQRWDNAKGTNHEQECKSRTRVVT
eukprot:6007517-Amphidinium_carterae.1